MRKLIFLACLPLFAQSNDIQLIDRDSPFHTLHWKGPTSMPSSQTVQGYSPIEQGFRVNGSTVYNLFGATEPAIHAWYDSTYGNAYLTSYGLTSSATPFNINQTTGNIGLLNGYVVAPGFVSDVPGGSWQGFNTNTDGALLRGIAIGPNIASTAGGYLDYAPVLYPPTSGKTCIDAFGNPVGQPTPLNGLAPTLWSTGEQYDILEWNSSSPLQGYQSPENGIVNTSGTSVTWVSGDKFIVDVPGDNLIINGVPYPIYSRASSTSVTLTRSAGTQVGVPFGGGWVTGVYPIAQTPCAAPLHVPVGAPFGLNTNSYYFALEGFAAGSQSPNAYDGSLASDGVHAAGGVIAGAIAAESIYPQGTVTRTGTLTNPNGTVLGGLMYINPSDQDAAVGTITTVDNPMPQGYTLSQGLFDYNTTIGSKGCMRYYNGLAWECIGSWIRNGSLLYPTNTSDKLLIGETSNASGANLDVAGTINSSGVHQVYMASGITPAFQVANGSTTPFVVYANGLVATSTSLGGGFEDTGLVSTAYLATNSAGKIVAAVTPPTSQWILSSGSIYPNSTGTKVLVGETTNSSGSIFEVYGTSASTVFSALNSGSGYNFVGYNSNFITDGNGNVSGRSFLANNSVPTTTASIIGSTGAITGASLTDTGLTSQSCIGTSSTGVLQAGTCGGSSNWTLSGSLLYPNSTSYKALVGRTTDDGSGAVLQVAGGFNVNGTIQGIVQTNNAYSSYQGKNLSNAQTFAVTGNGTIGTTDGIIFSGSALVAQSAGSAGLGAVSGGYQYITAAGAWAGWSPAGPSNAYNVTGSRTFNTVYHNTGSVAMYVTVSVSTPQTALYALIGSTSSVSIQAALVGTTSAIGVYTSTSFVVPAGWYYEIWVAVTVNESIGAWTEWY